MKLTYKDFFDDNYTREEARATELAEQAAAAEKKQIDEADVRFYLEMRIYVKEENITFDAENGLCTIRLNDVLTANIPIKSETSVGGILL